MKILAIDTSGQQAGAAIVDEYITIGEIMINAQSGPKSWHHSEILMPAIERLFALCGHTLEDIDYVAYTSGPGSFTGLRIGAATALGLARSINKPAVAVPTLDALAYNMLGMAVLEKGSLTECSNMIVPLMDARRGQVYAALYSIGQNSKFSRLTDYLASSVEDVLERVGELDTSAIFLGDGADAYKPAILDRLPKARFAHANSNRQRPASVGLCAIHQLQSAAIPGLTQDTPQLIYIRDPQAVRSKAAGPIKQP